MYPVLVYPVLRSLESRCAHEALETGVEPEKFFMEVVTVGDEKISEDAFCRYSNPQLLH